ncbi:uncharacterized protein [Amphiura filiformis]|uniref:uncharacterized protein n=1 Tax=Amphiura filiformis TaxID=82378 RepID=UPI003B20E7FA
MPDPEKDSSQYFKHHFKSQNVPFVVYADFESFTKPIQTCQPNLKDSYTKKYQKHEPSGFCYYIKCFDDSVYTQEPVIFTKESEDQDVAQIFVETLEQNIKEIYQEFKFQKEMIFGEQEREIFKKSTHCHICKDPLTPDDKDNYNVRDHCHYKGTFRGAAHNICNMKYRKPKFFPVIFHNLAGYDAHLFIKNLGKTEGEIDCIPSNEEKYISFTKKILVDTFTNKEGKEVDVKRDLRFIDSFKFMAAGLGKLVENLDEFSELPKFYQDEQLQLLFRKGVYPYDHVNSLEKLQETSLPPKDTFYSKLNEEHISDEDYEHAQNVWNAFEMKTMREYHDLSRRLIVNKVEKLISNLNDKEKYVIHHVALKQCLELGLKLTKVHRGIKYREEAFMKSYIDKNTSLRTKAESEFEKDFFKLMNNSVFGKTMENIRNRVNVHLVNSEHKAIKLAAKPNYQRCTIFDENLVAVHMKKTSLYFNKPIYLGASILDIAKTKMYDFHYNYIKKKYGNKAKLCMTDTDSLLYEIETEDFYEDIALDVNRYFDTSNYPADHPSGIPTGKNKKVPGMFKDEAGGKQIVEFVGLRAKLYSFRMHEGNEEKRCKGIKKAVVERKITFDDYKRCLFDEKPLTRTMNSWDYIVLLRVSPKLS